MNVGDESYYQNIGNARHNVCVYFVQLRNKLNDLKGCLDWGGKEGEGRGEKRSSVKLAENRLILGQIYITLLYSPSFPLNSNGPQVLNLSKVNLLVLEFANDCNYQPSRPPLYIVPAFLVWHLSLDLWVFLASMQGCLEIPFVEVCASETSLHLLS